MSSPKNLADLKSSQWKTWLRLGIGLVNVMQ